MTLQRPHHASTDRLQELTNNIENNKIVRPKRSGRGRSCEVVVSAKDSDYSEIGNILVFWLGGRMGVVVAHEVGL